MHETTKELIQPQRHIRISTRHT